MWFVPEAVSVPGSRELAVGVMLSSLTNRKNDNTCVRGAATTL
jgi:hypothetical protein